jgi:Na+/H+ antiporter NhaC
MTPRHYEVLPWVLIFIVVVIVLLFLAWLGYDNWSDLREVT